jgi:hypothetical protein
MPSSAIGGAMLPHVPQFFTIPETEDSAAVSPVKEVAHEIGNRLKALKLAAGAPRRAGADPRRPRTPHPRRAHRQRRADRR